MGRFHPDPRVGLSGEQVRQRVQQGLHNGISGIKTKTEGQIIRENVFTFFNILNFALAAAVILVGSFRSAVFLGVIFANIFIGSFQSIRAKRTLDKLSIVSAPKAAVLREGVKKEIPVEQVVLDDILVLSAGNQICSDAIVSAGECEVNESLITGESDPILKRPGDSLLSGSFVVSGSTTPPQSLFHAASPHSIWLSLSCWENSIPCAQLSHSFQQSSPLLQQNETLTHTVACRPSGSVCPPEKFCRPPGSRFPVWMPMAASFSHWGLPRSLAG